MCTDLEGQAGLLSTVISAFVVGNQPQLQQDPAEESAALLRVILYNMDKNAFGTNVPTVPEWTGPTSEIVAAQALLFFSLIITLSTAFLALLVKQLNVTAVGSRLEPDVERGQGQGRLLGKAGFARSIHTRLVLLPLQLQFGLLCFGCALTIRLWNVNGVVSRVILITMFGNIPFYMFVSLLGLYDIGFSPMRFIRYLIRTYRKICS